MTRHVVWECMAPGSESRGRRGKAVQCLASTWNLTRVTRARRRGSTQRPWGTLYGVAPLIATRAKNEALAPWKKSRSKLIVDDTICAPSTILSQNNAFLALRIDDSPSELLYCCCQAVGCHLLLQCHGCFLAHFGGPTCACISIATNKPIGKALACVVPSPRALPRSSPKL